jgi:hypothetical protein
VIYKFGNCGSPLWIWKKLVGLPYNCRCHGWYCCMGFAVWSWRSKRNWKTTRTLAFHTQTNRKVMFLMLCHSCGSVFTTTNPYIAIRFVSDYSSTYAVVDMVNWWMHWRKVNDGLNTI